MNLASYYDPEHKIHSFYMKEIKMAYEHRPLTEKEPFRNVSNEVELKKIHGRMQEKD